MIAAWMVYVLMVGTLAGGASWILERLLRSHRRPVRWGWLGGMALSAAWPVWTALRPEAEVVASGLPAGPPMVALEPLTLQVGTTSIWMALDGPLITFWMVSSSALLVLGIVLLFRTRLLRKRCRGEEADGREVLVSDDWGPAVVGLFNPQIVLPRWCHGMEEEGLRLILDHESEHLRAGDLRLLVLAGILPVFFPWSFPAWWMWHRLRLAVEGDCDLRVLKRNPRATRAYMDLLLEVGRRFPHGRAAAAMLSEPERTLERRIRTMTMPFPKKPRLRGIILAGVGLILIAVACAVPTPTAREEEAELPAVEAVVEEDASSLSDLARQYLDEPAFTPMTVRPGVRNRAEVSASMEREYPPLLKEAGVGGTVNVWFFIDETGAVRKTLVNESSGHAALDDAAVRVANGIEFTAAFDGEEPVPVWISLPITFSVRASEEGAQPTISTQEDAGASEPPEGMRPEVVTDTNVPTSFTEAPVLLNQTEVLRAIQDGYPADLRDTGIEGTVGVWLYVGEDGTVLRLLVNESSGYRDLDGAALRAVSQARFSTALDGDTPVAVWIALPVAFTVSERSSPTRSPRPAVPVRTPELRDNSPLSATTPPPVVADIATAPTFTPMTVRPGITNRAVISRAMEREYPPLLRDAGIGGTTNVWFLIDETGAIQRVSLNGSSGHSALDEAALRVARQVEFTPALNEDQRVPVWISLPITFTTR
jgi:TonB family protein